MAAPRPDRMPVTLAFDTSGPQVAAALLAGTGPALVRVEDMARGQAERLVPLLEEILAEAGLDWRGLDRTGVGIGTGNFTGIRISVATARGLSMALSIPAIGIDAFACLRGPDPACAVVLPAPRGQVYLQEPDAEPVLIPEAQLGECRHPLVHQSDIAPMVRIETLARLAAAQAVPGRAPAPLYLRRADAAPPRDPSPVILP